MILKEKLIQLRAAWAKIHELQNFVKNFKNDPEKAVEVKEKDEQLKQLWNSTETSWVDQLVKPLAELLHERTDAKRWEVAGPFGLGCETSIWLYFGNTDESDYKYLVLRPDWQERSEEDTRPENPFGVKIKDYNKPGRTDYAPNTIGAINGFNTGSTTPPADADLDWFIAQLHTDMETTEA